MDANSRVPDRTAPRDLAASFKQRILKGYFVRFHMSLILSAVMASGLLASKALLMAGVLYLQVRYALAVLASYGVFLLMVRLWVWYIVARPSWSSTDIDLPNVLSSGGAGDEGVNVVGNVVRFGGGDSGGAGASEIWSEAAVAPPVQNLAPSSSGSSFSMGNLTDVDLGDNLWILLLLALLVLGIVFAGGYLIFLAPDILPEAAWQVALASGIVRASKKMDPKTWTTGIVRASAIPLGVVLIFAIGLGWLAHNSCPHAVKLAEALRCAAR